MATIHGGDKLRNALVKLTRNISNGATLHVGFLSGATYPQQARAALRARYAKRRKKGVQGAVKGSAGGVSVAMIAAIQEFGAPSRNIPPRPFFRNMVKNKSKEWPAAIAALLKANNYDAKRTLELTGQAIAGQLRQSIVDTNSPPLKATTVKRKGFAKPLVDTSHMLNSVDYEVK
jgi:hypothetical protein